MLPLLRLQLLLSLLQAAALLSCWTWWCRQCMSSCSLKAPERDNWKCLQSPYEYRFHSAAAQGTSGVCRCFDGYSRTVPQPLAVWAAA